MIIALVSKKGGVGKSTTAVNLAAALARTGQEVLLIDLDPQASSSRSLGLERSELAPSSADVLFNKMSIDRAARTTSVKRLTIIPGSTDLSEAEHRLSQLRTGNDQLRIRLDRSRADFDFTLIDCQPSLSILPANAIIAADGYIVPTTPHFLAQEGLDNLLAAVERLTYRAHSRSRCLGLLLTMVDRRVRLMRESTQNLRERFDTRVLASEIRFCSKLAEAPAFGQTIFDYAGSSGAAQDYEQLAQEIQQLALTMAATRQPSNSAPTARPSPRRSWVRGYHPSVMENVG